MTETKPNPITAASICNADYQIFHLSNLNHRGAQIVKDLSLQHNQELLQQVGF